MAALAGEITRQIKGHSEGAMGFRPWWDTVEDNLMYAFVVLGLVSLPMTFFSKTPIECTPHPDNWPNVTAVKGLTRFYPKVYCTEMMIEPFLLYLPFTLLLVPIVLIAIEKTYVILYKVEDKMNQFYLLLVKESLATEDVSGIAKDNVRDCHEIEQAFKTSNDCYTSYLQRTALELLCSLALAVLFALHNGIAGIGVPFFDCNVYGYLFSCIVPNSQFFLYVYVLSFFLIGGYFCCSLYNFAWILSAKVGKLSHFLDGCKRYKDSYTEKMDDKNNELKGPAIRLNLYFRPRAHDFNLLINLLAESQGLPEALRILALFEHQFGSLWMPQNARLFQKSRPVFSLASNGDDDELVGKVEEEKADESPTLETLVATWDDAIIANYFHKCFRGRYTFEYSVEVISETVEVPIKSIVFYADQAQIPRRDSWLEEKEEEEKRRLDDSMDEANKEDFLITAGRKYNLTFDGLESGKTYKLIFSTEINGRTITQMTRDFECLHWTKLK